MDIGLPQLAMHSCYETASTADTAALLTAMTRYFSTTLTRPAPTGYTLH